MDQAKIDLSGFTPAIVDVEVNDDRVETLEITRDDFENKIAKTEFDKIENYIKNLKEHTKGHDVTDVLLVRGSTRTKRIIDLVGEHFRDVPIVKCLNTDECIVMGTALKGALKNGIHRTAYAEVEDVAMHDQWVETDGIQLYLTKKYESVQNSKEHWIEPLGKNKLTYNGNEIDTKSGKTFSWKRDVACDPCIMTENRIQEEMTKGFNPGK
jgi:molecular chaperone DnaK (HSP70)